MEAVVKKHYVYLIPGFFGFADLGAISYFHHVREILEELLEDYGIAPEIHYVSTVPTGSIRRRAYFLGKQIAETATDPSAPIHLIGHSTGGLDARLFASPSVSLLDELDTEEFAGRISTIVSVASPHYGTPLARFFDGLLGQRLLYLLSMITVHALRFGKFPLSAVFSIVGVISRLDDFIGWDNTIVDQFYDNLFADLEDEHFDQVSEYLESIRTDQTLLGQLTPGGIDLFNAAAEDRPGVRYGCAITRARKPEVDSILDIGLDPYRQASHIIYRFLYLIAGGGFAPPTVSEDERQIMLDAYGSLPAANASDGVVPTWSQLHGELIHATWADHLDVCGHFTDPARFPPHVDWLCSSTGFSRDRFDALWRDIAAFIGG